MVVVKVVYPGKVFLYSCDREAAAWLVAQFKGNEWATATIKGL